MKMSNDSTAQRRRQLALAAAALMASVPATAAFAPPTNPMPSLPASSSLSRTASNAFGIGSPSQLQVSASVSGTSSDDKASNGKLDVLSAPASSSSSSSSSTDASGAIIMPNVEDIDFDWQALAHKVFEDGDARPIILFDGVCNLCNGGVNFAIDHDESGKFRFASLQSKVGQALLLSVGKAPHDLSNIILMTSPTQGHYSSDAISRICSELDTMPLQIFGKVAQMTPNVLREGIYHIISSNRYQFGEYDSCRIDFDGTLTSRFVQDLEDEEHRLV
eukprot:CAMPEP_0119550100 /NCGR_PEP_ID=MMETSP1352-20130426/3697_1 /TAXON_ID=265584 /ORGANISM="Stauroneis constricta, Strain CCMP1120" /LENGTH=275 /DNA_ID=CAMNT_0007595857 /DNA_START=197 /DNA_END=1024 /DNA_ORIENTATION=+